MPDARARFRYRINDGSLWLGIALDRPRDVLRAAFDGVCTDVAAATSLPIWQGSPD